MKNRFGNRIIAAILFIVLIVGAIPAIPVSAYDMIISTAEDLYKCRELINSQPQTYGNASILIEKDIDLTQYSDVPSIVLQNGVTIEDPYNWEPIWNFSGTIEGALFLNEHGVWTYPTIKGLFIDPTYGNGYTDEYGNNVPGTWHYSNGSCDNIGFISGMSAATVSRLYFDVDKVEGCENVGALAGVATESTVVECRVGPLTDARKYHKDRDLPVYGTVIGYFSVGGLIGNYFNPGRDYELNEQELVIYPYGSNSGTFVKDCMTEPGLSVLAVAKPLDSTGQFEIPHTMMNKYNTFRDSGFAGNISFPVSSSNTISLPDTLGMCAGGIIGSTSDYGPVLYECSNNAYVRAYNYCAAGILAYASYGPALINCANRGAVFSFAADRWGYIDGDADLAANIGGYTLCDTILAGGIIAYAGNGTVIESCENYGMVYTGAYVGGIAGYVAPAVSDSSPRTDPDDYDLHCNCRYSVIANSFNMGDIVALNSGTTGAGLVGFLAGYDTSTVSPSSSQHPCDQCHFNSIATVSGYCDNRVENCYSILGRAQKGTSYPAACLVGENYGVVRNCFASMTVNDGTPEGSDFGLIAHYNDGFINHCFSTAAGPLITSSGPNAREICNYKCYRDPQQGILTYVRVYIASMQAFTNGVPTYGGPPMGSFVAEDELDAWANWYVKYQTMHNVGGGYLHYNVNYQFRNWRPITFGSREYLIFGDYNELIRPDTRREYWELVGAAVEDGGGTGGGGNATIIGGGNSGLPGGNGGGTGGGGTGGGTTGGTGNGDALQGNVSGLDAYGSGPAPGSYVIARGVQTSYEDCINDDNYILTVPEDDWSTDGVSSFGFDADQFSEDGSYTLCINYYNTAGIEEHMIVYFATEDHTDHIYCADTYPASCAENGYVKYTCVVCGDSYTEELYATGHSDPVRTVTVEPDCANPGLAVWYCPRCLEVLSEENIDPNGHSGEWVTVSEPTCTEYGEEQYICTVCNEVLATNPIYPNGHSAGDWEVIDEPTCTERGHNELRCTVCGALIDTEDPDPNGHSGEWVRTAEPTCTEYGEEQYICTVCNEVLATNPINPNGHSAGDWVTVTEPTCTEYGYQEIRCTVCGELLNTWQLDPNGHSGEWIRTAEPTCTEYGEEQYICTVCNEVLATNPIYPFGHTEGAWKTIAEPTEDTPGLRGVRCTVCEEILDSSEVLAMFGDVNGDGIITSRDVRVLKQYLAGLLEDDDIVMYNADANEDYDITSKDIRSLKQMMTE